MKQISPNRIVDAVEENFKGVLSKPNLKSLILVTIAISLAKKLKINPQCGFLPSPEKLMVNQECTLLLKSPPQSC